MARVIKFAPRGERDSYETDKKLSAWKAPFRLISLLWRTARHWTYEMAMDAIAFLLPLIKLLGKASIVLLILTAIFEACEHWKHQTVLLVPLAATIFMLILHTTFNAILSRNAGSLGGYQ